MARTGVFIAAMSEVERVKAEGEIDLFQTVKAARSKRPHMISTPVSYGVCVVWVRGWDVCVCVCVGVGGLVGGCDVCMCVWVWVGVGVCGCVSVGEVVRLKILGTTERQADPNRSIQNIF